MRILTHRPVEECDFRAMLLEFLDQEYLMHVVAGQTIGRRDQDAVEPCARSRIAQSIKTRALQTGPTVAVIPEDIFRDKIRALRKGIGLQPLDLLLSRLALGLARRRDACVGG
jgi:hypothetical protein